MSDYNNMIRCLWKGVADTDQQIDAADRIEKLEERLKAATDDAKEAEAYAGELEAVLESIKAKLSESEALLAKAVEIGDKMAASIEGNYYLPGVATDWRKLTGGKDD